MNRREFQRLLLGAAAFSPVALHAESGKPSPAAQALVSRLLGKDNAAKIRCELYSSKDEGYTITTLGDTLILRASTIPALGAALNDWMRHEAKLQLSWTGENLQLPSELPLPKEPRSARCTLPYRVAYNFCTFGYTMPWWQWDKWERELDFLTLMGVNMPLAMIGHEIVWSKVLPQIGMSKDQVLEFLCDPSYFPWQFMANIERWKHPLPESWLSSRFELAKKIYDRMRELGMTPIAPGFTGYIPTDLKELHPDADIFLKREWFGFSKTAQLNPTDPLFSKISKLFVKEQHALFGEVHWYACDVFHESKPPSDDPAYLESVGKGMIKALKEADPKAKIAMQTWSLYEHIVKAIPKDDILLLDLDGRRKSYWGYPYVSGVIHNFGGRVFLGGRLEKSLMFDEHATRKDFDNCQGLGVFCEGSYNNSPIYMAAMEGAFRTKGSNNDPEKWITDWAKARYGIRKDSAGHALKAWKESLQHIYHKSSSASYQSGETPFCMRPTLSGRYSSPSAGSFSRSYNPKELWQGVKDLAKDADTLKGLDTYQYDLVDWTRQALADLGVILHKEMLNAYKAGDNKLFEAKASAFMELGRDLDSLLDTRAEFRLGTWISEARAWGKTKEEQDIYESSARQHVTLWGPNTQRQVNFDYSNRVWSGLISSFYLPRWEIYLDYLRKNELPKPVEERLDDNKIRNVYGRPGPESHPIMGKIAAWEQAWADTTDNSHSATPKGDPVTTALAMISKYDPVYTSFNYTTFSANIPSDAYVLGAWESDEVSTKWENKQWNLEGKLSDHGKFAITFKYAHGSHMLRARNVKILQDGKEVSIDAHSGSTGTKHVDNVWHLTLPNVTQAEGLVLHAEVKTEGGSDSNGIIFAQKAK